MWTWRRASRRPKRPDSHGLLGRLPVFPVPRSQAERFKGHWVLHRRPLLIAGILVTSLLLGDQGTPPVAWAEQADTRAQAFTQAVAGWHLLQTGDYRGAERAFSQAVAVVPEEPSFYVGLGVSRLRLSKEEQAALMLERAIRLDPQATMAHDLLGDVNARSGEWAAAIQHYGIAVRQDPNDVSLQERLLNAQRSHVAEVGFDSLHTAHFTVKFQGPTG